MRHLVVGLFALSLLAISVHYKVVKVDTKLLHENAWNIVEWIARLLLGVIIASWLK